MTIVTVPFENCNNPWKTKCKKKDIEVYIYYKNERLPICKKCWKKIAEKDVEW
jgi:hypothetical protein